jgi:hypothetical protein
MNRWFPPQDCHAGTIKSYAKTLALACAFFGLAGCQSINSGNPAPSNQSLQAKVATISFGAVQVGSQHTQTETLTNTSASTVTVSGAIVSGAGFSASGMKLPQSLPAGQSVAFTVTFAPTAAGTSSGSIAVTSDASSSSLMIALSGSATSQAQPGQLTLSPPSITFGNVVVGNSQNQTVTLGASGASVTIASSPAVTAPFSLSGASFPLAISAGQNASLTVTFTPKSSGTASENLSFASDASNSPAVLTAAGNGVSAQPALSHGMFILDPPSNDGNCAGMPSACYSQHLVPTLICTGNNTPAGYGCTQQGAGEPYIKGAMFYVAWNFVNPTNGSYDFTIPDTRATPWTDSGKLVAYDFIPTTQGSSNNITPSWYLTPVNISTVSQIGGIITLQTASDMVFFPGAISGAAGLEIQITSTGTALDGNGTSANPGIWTVCDHNTAGCLDPTLRTITAIGSGSDIAAVSKGTVSNPVYGTVNCGSGTLPIEWRPNFIKAWQILMQQVVAHYASNKNVAYLRFGLGIGGENIPNHGTQVAACQTEMTTDGFTGSPGFPAPWPSPSSLQWPQVSATWIAYLKKMVQYENSLNSPRMIATTLSPIETSGGDTTTPDATAANAVAAGIGIGNQGLQKSDPVNFAAGQPCLGGDWCANFVKYKGQVPLELQTLGNSDPTDANIDGSLVHTLPFATSLGAQIMELYVDDWLCTYDSTWSGINTYGACTAAGYPAVFSAAAAQIN